MLVQAWRKGRHTKDPAKKAIAYFALMELCALADAYTQEDDAAGRLRAIEYIKWMKATGHSPSADRIISPQAQPRDDEALSTQP